MLTAKYNYSKQGVDCEVEGTTMEIVGELSAGFKEWKYEE